MFAMVGILHHRKYKMPRKAGKSCDADGKSDAAESAKSVTAKASLELPVSAVAGLLGKDAEEFEKYVDSCERACPSIHCWTPAGDVLIGCSTGELLMVMSTDDDDSIVFETCFTVVM